MEERKERGGREGVRERGRERRMERTKMGTKVGVGGRRNRQKEERSKGKGRDEVAREKLTRGRKLRSSSQHTLMR